MSDLVQILDYTGTDDNCGGLLPIVRLLRKGVYPIFQIGIPILLIVFGTIDLGKAVIASDEKEIKAAQSRLIKRCIYAVAVFFVVTLVSLIMDIVAKGNPNDANTTSWGDCWRAANQ